MIDLVKGRTVEDARRLIGLYFDMIKGKITPEQLDDLEDAAALQGIAHVPARVKCAVLAWHTLEEALDGEGIEVRFPFYAKTPGRSVREFFVLTYDLTRTNTAS